MLRHGLRKRCILYVSVLVLWGPIVLIKGSNCTEGYYESGPDGSCVKCGSCPDGEVEFVPCTRSSNVICRCIKGSYRLYPTWSFWGAMTCGPCRTCGTRGARLACTEYQDTVCNDCPRDTFLYNSTTCLPCWLCPQGDLYPVRMNDCEVSGLPPWMQCAPPNDHPGKVNVSYVPFAATKITFVPSATDFTVYRDVLQDSSLTALVVSGSTLVCVVILMLCAVACVVTCCIRTCIAKSKKDSAPVTPMQAASDEHISEASSSSSGNSSLLPSASEEEVSSFVYLM